MAAPVSCVACRELPEEGTLSRHLFFSPAVDLTTMASSTPTPTPPWTATRRPVFPALGLQPPPSRGDHGWGPFYPEGSGKRGGSLAWSLHWQRFSVRAPDGALTKSRCPPTASRSRLSLGRQSAAAVNNIALLSSAMVSLSADRETYGPEEAARWLAVSRFSSAILQLCQPIAVSAGRHLAWATMIQRVIWLSHTAVAERERASLVQGPLAPDCLFGPRFSEVLAHQQSVRENRSRFGAILTRSSHQQAGRRRSPGRFQDSSPGAAAAAAADCPVAVGWRSDGVFTWPLVHLLLRSGVPWSRWLHEPVDTAACTGLPVPHIIAVGSPSLRPLCVLARAVRSAIVFPVEMGPSHTVQASSPTLYGVGGDHATGPGCEQGSGSRGGTSLDSSGCLLANGWTPGDTSSGCSSFTVRCRQTWNIGKDPPPFSGVFPWAGWRPT
ncbi:unnamed protein product [Boreogadus saida]